MCMQTRELFILLGIFVLLAGCRKEKEPKITEYVNPFSDVDNCNLHAPGATVPFGALQVNPNYDDEKNAATPRVITSFSHTHLRGDTLGNLHNLKLLPVVTAPQPHQSIIDYIATSAASFLPADEQAEPGYYQVKLENGIMTELAATNRCGFHYYHYPDGSPNGLILDLTDEKGITTTTASGLKKINNRVLQGFRKSHGIAGEQQIYFVIEFSQDFHILAGGDSLSPLGNGQQRDNLKYAWIDFGQVTNQILAKVSVSTVNYDGAKANLDKEMPHWSFDKVKKDALHLWKKELLKTKAESKNEETLKNFYTALYHSYMAPNTCSDVNGNFTDPNGEIRSVGKNTQYNTFYLHNTFRALYPLFIITQKKRVDEILNSIYVLDGNKDTLVSWSLTDAQMANTECIRQPVSYVFAALGFYPENTDKNQYQLTPPLLDKVVIKVGVDKKFTITTQRETPQSTHIKEVQLNGEILERRWINLNEIMQGGKLEFFLTDKE